MAFLKEEAGRKPALPVVHVEICGCVRIHHCMGSYGYILAGGFVDTILPVVIEVTVTLNNITSTEGELPRLLGFVQVSARRNEEGIE